MNIKLLNPALNPVQSGLNAITSLGSSSSVSKAAAPPMVSSHHHGHGGAMLQSLLSALSQAGLNVANLSPGSSSASSSGADGDGDGSGGSSVSASTSGSGAQQALATFMQNLFAALNGSSSSTSSAGSTSNYGGFQTQLSDLISQVSGQTLNASTQGSAALSPLEQSFQALSQTLGSSSAGSSGQLGTFLQDLQQNLSQQGQALNGQGLTVSQYV